MFMYFYQSYNLFQITTIPWHAFQLIFKSIPYLLYHESNVIFPSLGRKCLRPASIAHGRIIQESEDFPAGSIIRFECKTGDGYYLFGPEQQKCMPDSNGDMRWSPKRPLCITKNRFEEYCALQNKVMTLDPTPGCMTRRKFDDTFFNLKFCHLNCQW